MSADTRYRISGLRRIDGAIRCQLEIPFSSPYFEGHFPSNPVLPGLAQVQILTDALCTGLGRSVQLREIENVRFRKPVVPDTACELEIQGPDDEGRISFRLTNDDGLISDGVLAMTTREDEAHA